MSHVLAFSSILDLKWTDIANPSHEIKMMETGYGATQLKPQAGIFLHILFSVFFLLPGTLNGEKGMNNYGDGYF